MSNRNTFKHISTRKFEDRTRTLVEYGMDEFIVETHCSGTVSVTYFSDDEREYYPIDEHDTVWPDGLMEFVAAFNS